MTHLLPPRSLLLPILVMTLALVASVSAQDPQASPSPSPSPATAPAKAETPLVVDAPVEVDAAEIEAEVERAEARARREAEKALNRQLETAMKAIQGNRVVVERGAETAAREKALVEALRSKALSEAARTTSLSGITTARAIAEMQAAAMEAEMAHEASVHEAWPQGTAEQREKELEAREKEREGQQARREEARERAEANRERARELAQERRETERERRENQSEKAEDLYEQAMELIDDEEWSDALRPLSKLMSLNSRLDAALYWSGYAQGKMNRTASALATLARLQKEFPTSRWAKEGKALEMEVRGKSGQAPRPDQEDDLDLKLMALSSLAQSDPQEALPLLAKILSTPTAARKVRERSLFVLAQMGTEQAGNAIAEVAKGNSSPELQRKAIQYLGVFGGPANRKILSDVYSATTDNPIRRQILNSFMVSGDKARVLNAARTEKDAALRADAIRLLGVMGGSSELSQMYEAAVSTDEKKAILHALFLSGAIESMANAAKGEKDKEARLSAVRNLGLMGRKSEIFLSEMYRAETDFEIKKEVLNAFFLQGNSVRLVEIARVEKDAQLKKEAVHWLSLMNSRESRAFMIELLK